MAIAPDPRVPAYSLEAEMSVLGSMLLDDRVADEITTLLNDEDFYRPAHAEIFRAMRQLLRSMKGIDFLTLREELVARGKLAEIGGEGYLVEIADYTPTPANAVYYAQIVLDKATLRRLESAGRAIVGMVQEPDEASVDEKVDQAERMVFDVASGRAKQDFLPVSKIAYEFYLEIDDLKENKEPIVGVPSGYFDLDAMTSGFYPGDFVIVAARPSMGKTSLVLNFAINVAQQNKGNVAIFSLEMSSMQLVRRMVSMIAGVGQGVLKNTYLGESDYKRLGDACDTLSHLPIYIDETSDVNGLEVRGKCRRLKSQGGLALVVVDYLQLMRGNRKTENRVQEVGDIARSLKALAKELKVPVIALSQLSRTVESRPDKRPMLSDLRESGSIEAEADLVMFIYRESYYEKKELHNEKEIQPDEVFEAEIVVAKHRNGPTGTAVLGFQPHYARFVNLRR